MNNIRYVVHPGWVKSATDGQHHFIGFPTLCRLYQVNPQECINAQNHRQLYGWSEEAYAALKHLNPRYDGKYSLFG